jgi:predicted transglutaminase-like cysteine proteinase
MFRPFLFSLSPFSCRQGISLLLFLFFFSLPGLALNLFSLSEQTLAAAEKKYGAQARSQLLAWEQLVREDKSTTDTEKLEKVNAFFNEMKFVDDSRHWQQEDYWATPVEFLASGGGDCEDFSIAKYFTLKALGIDEKKLSLTYVKAIELDQAHMVLTYYPTPAADPLVLDNLVQEIKPASKRPDLLPVYSFNGSGLWLAKERGRGKQVGSSKQINQWQNLLERIENPIN